MAKDAGGPDLTASGVSQAQTGATDQEDVKRQNPEELVDDPQKPGDEIQHFEGSIAKLDKDGNVVLSDHLAPGEKLQRATDEDEAREASETRAAANERKTKRDSK